MRFKVRNRELNVSNRGGSGLLLQLKLTAALALVVLLKIAQQEQIHEEVLLLKIDSAAIMSHP